MVVKVGDEYKSTYGLQQFTDDLLETDKVKNSKILTKAVKFGNQASKSLGEAIVDVLPSVGDSMKQRTITAEAPEITQAKKFLVSKIGKQAVKVLSNINIKDINLKPVITSVKDAILDSDVTIDEAVKIIQAIVALRGLNLSANQIKTGINLTSSLISPDRVLTKIGRKAAYKLVNRLLTGGKETVITEKEYLDALQRSGLQGPFDSKPKKKEENVKTSKQKKKTSKTKGSNDLSWYTHYSSLLSTVSGLQWQYPNGSVFDHRNSYAVRKAGASTATEYPNLAVPTVASFAIKLVESDANSTACMSRIFATLRRANSGSVNYKIKDLSAYIFNLRLIIAMYSSLRRVYGVLPKSTHTDLTRPYSTVAAMGYDYNTFSQNAANLRSFLKQWAKRLEMYMPYAFPILKRTEWLFDNVYLTSVAEKDQEFVLKLAPVQTYYAYSGSGAAGTFTNIAVTTSYPNSSYTGLDYSTVIANFETIASNFVSENTNSIIAGDMLKAFGAGNLHKLADIPEDYSVTPVFNQEVLDQISNAVMPEKQYAPTYSWVMADDNGYNGDNAIVRVTITDTPLMQNPGGKFVFLNTDRNDFSPAYVLSASRFAFTPSNTNVINFGSEIVECYTIIQYDASSTNPYKLVGRQFTSAVIVGTFASNSLADFIPMIPLLKTFDYLPKLQIYVSAVTAESTVVVDGSGHITSTDYESDTTSYVYDWGNWTPVSDAEMKAIQNTAIMSLYYCPLEYREVKTLTLVSD